MWPASSFIDCVSSTETCTRYGDTEEEKVHSELTVVKSATKNYWKDATQTEGLVLIFLYFAAYLTGIGALLDRLRSPSDDVIPLNVDDFLNATNATALASDDAANESDPIAVQVVYWILLAFYSLVPVAGCAFFGLETTKSHIDEHGDEVGCPMNQTEQEYAEWMEERLDNDPQFTIIAPFEKKYSWCVVWIEGIEGCRANMCATTPGTKGRLCSKASRSPAASC